MEFSKFTGCGNDFIVVDDRCRLFPSHNRDLVRRLCHRRFGIGADGLLLLQDSSHADFRMRIFNADGSEAEMCGNGIRCLMAFIESLGHRNSSYQIETMERTVRVERQGCQVAVAMGEAKDLRWHLPLDVLGRNRIGHSLYTGVPHLVIIVENLEEVDVQQEGSVLRYHAAFQPRGTNVNYAALGPTGWSYRTYERGVEGETLACGTGATAVALALAKLRQVESPINLRTRSGEEVSVAFQRQGDSFCNIRLIGPATFIFRGTLPFCRTMRYDAYFKTIN